MGQSQSQSQSDNQPVLVNRAPTPEPKDPIEAQRVREEREKRVAEERARRAAAAEQRLASQAKKKTGAGTSSGPAGPRKKNETALEQASRENKGWRDADVMADLRAYN